MNSRIKKIQQNPTKSAIKLGIPIIILLFLDTLYSIIDIYWINGIGISAIIAMGYILNIVYTFNKVGDGIGRSVNVLISTAFGADDQQKIQTYANNGFYIMILLSIIIPILSIPFIGYICNAAGIAKYSDLIFAYLSPTFGFIIFVMMNNYFSALLASEGDTKRATIIIIAGNIMNLIIDPILIFKFNLGMLGAGIATTLGCAFSLALFIYIFYIKADTLVKVSLRKFDIDWAVIRKIIVLAIPIILDGIILSIVGIILNYALHLYAPPEAAFVFVIMLRIQITVFTPIQGLTKGMCIVVGHLSGAKRFQVMKNTITKIILIGLAIAGVISAMIVIFHTPLMSVFSTDLIVHYESRSQLIYMIIAIMINPIIMTCSYVYVGLEKSAYTFYFLIVNIVLLLILLTIFSHVIGLGSFGVFSALTLANIIEAAGMLVVLKIMLDNRISRPDAVSV